MKIKAGFILKDVAGKTFVVATGELSKKFKGMITLNETGKFIWNLLENDITKEEIVDVKPEFGATVSEKDGKRTTITTELLNTHYVIGFDAEHTKEDLAIILDFVQYLEYLEKWDGKLPTVMTGTDGVEIIIPNNGNDNTTSN